MQIAFISSVGQRRLRSLGRGNLSRMLLHAAAATYDRDSQTRQEEEEGTLPKYLFPHLARIPQRKEEKKEKKCVHSKLVSRGRNFPHFLEAEEKECRRPCSIKGESEQQSLLTAREKLRNKGI